MIYWQNNHFLEQFASAMSKGKLFHKFNWNANVILVIFVGLLFCALNPIMRIAIFACCILFQIIENKKIAGFLIHTGYDRIQAFVNIRAWKS